jgi:hypothetical protein
MYTTLYTAIDKNKYYTFEHVIDKLNAFDSKITTPSSTFICKIFDYWIIAKRFGNRDKEYTSLSFLNPFNRNISKIYNKLQECSVCKIYMLIKNEWWKSMNIIKQPKYFVNTKLLAVMEQIYRSDLEHHENSGLLLHGLPGCGKSTNIRAFAHMMKFNIYYATLNLSSIALSLSNVKPGGAIVIFEDSITDLLITLKRKSKLINKEMDDGDDDTKKLKSEKIEDKDSASISEFSTFLNLMSGTIAVSKCLFIFTTNHMNLIMNNEELWKLFRYGRIGTAIKMDMDQSFQVQKFHHVNDKLELR